MARDFVDMISDEDKYDGKFEGWQNAKISKTTILFGVDNDKKSYLFRLSVKGEYVGHVVVSATKDNYPILEFSKGKSPIDTAKEKGIDSQKAYRIHAMTYYFKDIGKYYDIHGKQVDFNKIQKRAEQAKEKPEVKKHLAKRAKEAREEWNERLNNNNNGPTSSHTVYGNIKLTSRPGNVDESSLWIIIQDNTVPLVQPSDVLCAPTSAAMVLAYWDQSGYPAFPDNYNFDLVYDLEDIMGEWYVSPDALADGINIYTDNKGYDSDWAHTETPDLSEAKNELSNGRPFNLHLLFAGNAIDRPEDDDYSNHVIEVHGWIEAGGDYLAVYDTWDYDEHYFEWGDWWGATNIYVEPGWA